MDAGRRMRWTVAALAVVVAFGVPLAAGAQTPPGAATGELYTPAPDARDLKAVLFNWMWHMGMLKGTDERDMVATLEYQGRGTTQVDGQPCRLTRFRASTNYQTYSQRIQYACTRAGGQEVSNIEVVSGLYAWDEDVAGAGLGPTGGTATPMAAAVQERLIRLWASPQGAPKAALAGTTETWWLGANPGTLFADGLDRVGQTSVSWDSGRPVVTFPVPGVAGAAAVATLDEQYMTERVVVTQGTTTTEFAYSDYKDWNNPLNLIEVFYAGRMIERRNGTVVRDLTTEQTETGNVYVIAPVPASVRAALRPTGQMPTGVFAKPDVSLDTSSPTPRLANGQPDLTGAWQHTDWIGNYMGGGGRRCGPTQAEPCNRMVNQTEDFELYSPSRFGQLNRPQYKPQYWDQVIELDMWTNRYDPVMTCQPLGVPRQGPPRRIYQSENDITFIYFGGDAGGGYGEYRIIPTDGRAHAEDAEYDITYLGNTVGRWEGDTLVLDAIGFIDTTWLGRGGFFHTDRMHVVERFRRQGTTIFYDVTVEDPEVLMEPWVLPTRTLRLNPSPNGALIRERGNCETAFETEAAATQIRH